jgi:chemotaxis signal transduction protein
MNTKRTTIVNKVILFKIGIYNLYLELSAVKEIIQYTELSSNLIVSKNHVGSIILRNTVVQVYDFLSCANRRIIILFDFFDETNGFLVDEIVGIKEIINRGNGEPLIFDNKIYSYLKIGNYL